ncbi:MAG: chemotaxis response regulator protein-glutamate methylesterase [Polyangiaceae bacterium]|nr:chemotaxis response regulator protein-glutamate methylesterase [Polyangiaceae bacterium]
MKKIRVLIVDDAVVIRKILSDVLSAEPDMDVVGTAANGALGLKKIEQLSPDVVLLDVEMPEMNGIETIRAIRPLYPRLPVIMFSTLTNAGAATTIEALLLGATDYATKPANVGSTTNVVKEVQTTLLPKIRNACGQLLPAQATAVRQSAPPRLAKPIPASNKRPEILVIGTSTGGPNALAEVLKDIPASFPVPVLIVQHMPPLFTHFLAERLNKNCPLRIREAVDDTPLLPGECWIARGDYHMDLKRTASDVRLALNQAPPENSCRPAVDVTFRAVARLYGGASLAVVLTGMGQDGLRGGRAIRSAGGRVLAQDQASSVVWGMPGAVIEAGIAEAGLPLSQVAAAILERFGLSKRTAIQAKERAVGNS